MTLSSLSSCILPNCSSFSFCSAACSRSLCALATTYPLLLMARIDNLGKGASGAAVQTMNLHLGLPEGLGLQD